LSLDTWQRAAADASHFALYACLFVLPLVGYLGSNFSKHGILLYGAVKLRPWGPDDKQFYDLFRSMHTVVAWVLVVLVCVHVAAAVYHAVRRDGIMGRMLPGMSLR
jgi:cytochrome b561